MKTNASRLAAAAVFCILLTLLSARLRADVAVAVDASGNVTLTVPEGETASYGEIIAGSGIIVAKDGLGTLTLTGANTFTGTLLVKEGKLVAAPANTAGKPALIVENGATFKSAGDPNGTTLNLPTITICGHGVGGQGAFIRASGTAISDMSTQKLILAGDATVNFAVTHNPGVVNLNGYKLTKIGSGDWINHLASDAQFTVDGEGGNGSIELKGGWFNMKFFPIAGSEKNTFIFNGGHFTCTGLESWESVPWSCQIAADTVFYVNGNALYWNGPVKLDGAKLKLRHSDKDRPIVFNNTVTGTGGAGLTSDTGGGVVGFKKAVTIGSGGIAANLANDKLTFEADVTLNGGRIVANSQASASIVFKGKVTQTGNASGILPSKGTVSFNGAVESSFAGVFGDSSLKRAATGAIRILNTSPFLHQNHTYLSGTKDAPQIFFVSNSTVNAGSKYIYAGNNYSWGIVDLQESIVTNNVQLGSEYNKKHDDEASGALYQRAGELVVPGTMLIGTGRPARGQGGYVNEGGHLTANAVQFAHCAYGLIYSSGGMLSVNSVMEMTMGHSGNNGTGVYWLSNGATNTTPKFTVCQTGNLGTSGRGIIALEGAGTLLSVTGADGLSLGADYASSYNLVVAVNDGAELRAAKFCRTFTTDYAPNVKCTVNMDGGSIALTVPATQIAPERVIVQEGGATLETSVEGTFGWETRFDAPVGQTVAAIALPTDAGFVNAQGKYSLPPKVVISGTGTGAAAVATFDKATRRVTGIRVVAPGTGYDETTTAKVSFPARNVSYTCAVTLAPVPTTGAGFTKTGPGIYTLAHTNTYVGVTTVAGGTLVFAKDRSLPVGSGLALANGATADFSGHAVTVPTLSGGAGTVADLASLTVTNTLTLTMVSNALLNVDAPLTLADGATLELTGTVEDLDETRNNVLLSVSGGLTVPQGLVLPALPTPWRAVVRAKDIVVRKAVGTVLTIR